jgi:hypothetical protein
MFPFLSSVHHLPATQHCESPKGLPYITFRRILQRICKTCRIKQPKIWWGSCKECVPAWSESKIDFYCTTLFSRHLRSVDPSFTSLWQCGSHLYRFHSDYSRVGILVVQLSQFLHQSCLPATVEVGGKDNDIDFYCTCMLIYFKLYSKKLYVLTTKKCRTKIIFHYVILRHLSDDSMVFFTKWRMGRNVRHFSVRMYM